MQCSQDKIHQGLRVHMDVRGSSALMHVIRALCSVKAGNICKEMTSNIDVFSTSIIAGNKLFNRDVADHNGLL